MESSKTCPRCTGVFSLEIFGVKTKVGRIVPNTYCPECLKAYRREHYHKNPEAYKARTKISNAKARQALRMMVIEYLLQHPCIDCGNKDIRVLEFDHIAGTKSFDVGSMASFKKDVMMDEIAKCVVRCGNCHKIATGERGKRWWTRSEYAKYLL